jgi:hypothetical protein
VGVLALSLWAQDSTVGGASSLNSSTDSSDFTNRRSVRVGLAGAESVPISVSIYVNGSYDTLLGAFRTDSSGNLAPSSGSYGVEGGFTVSGQKRLRRSVFGVSYIANYNHFVNVNNFNGTNQSINLAYSRRFNKRTDLVWNTAGSITNRVLGNPINLQMDNLEFLSTPVNELFDTRIYFIQSNLSVGYLVNNRWQLQFGGNGGVVRRQARALADTNLYGGTAGASYRLNRRSTLGFTYTYSHFDFGKQFGESDIHGVAASYTRGIGRGWSTSAHVTVFDVQTIGVRRVALDPVIAALLGTNQGSEAFQSRTKTPGFGANVSKRFRRTSYSVGVDRGVQPGNGLILTSLSTMYTASINYELKAKWTLNAGVNSSELAGIGDGTTMGNFKNNSAQLRVSRMLNREIGFIGGVEYRQFELAGSVLDRRGTRVTFGLTYVPNSLPFGK